MASVKKPTSLHSSVNPKIAMTPSKTVNSATAVKKPLVSKTSSTVLKKPSSFAAKISSVNVEKTNEKASPVKAVKPISIIKPIPSPLKATTKLTVPSTPGKAPTKVAAVKSIADSTSKLIAKSDVKSAVKIPMSSVKPTSVTKNVSTKPISKIVTSPASSCTVKKPIVVVKSTSLSPITASSPKSVTTVKSVNAKAKPVSTIKVPTLKSSVVAPSPIKARSSSITSIKPSSVVSKTTTAAIKTKTESTITKTSTTSKPIISSKSTVKSPTATKTTLKSTTCPVAKSVPKKGGSGTPKSIRTRPSGGLTDVIKRLQDESEIEICDADSTTVEERDEDYVANDADSAKLGTREENFKQESKVDEQRVYAVAEQLICVMQPDQLEVITGDVAEQSNNDAYVIDMSAVEMQDEVLPSTDETSKSSLNDETIDISATKVDEVEPSTVEACTEEEESSDNEVTANSTELLHEQLETETESIASIEVLRTEEEVVFEMYEMKIQEITDNYRRLNDIPEETTEEKNEITEEKTDELIDQKEEADELEDSKNIPVYVDSEEFINNVTCTENVPEEMNEMAQNDIVSTLNNTEVSVFELGENETGVHVEESTEVEECNNIENIPETDSENEFHELDETLENSSELVENSTHTIETPEHSNEIELECNDESVVKYVEIEQLNEDKTVILDIDQPTDSTMNEIHIKKVENENDINELYEVSKCSETSNEECEVEYRADDNYDEIVVNNMLEKDDSGIQNEIPIVEESINNIHVHEFDTLKGNLPEEKNVENLSEEIRQLISFESDVPPEVDYVDIESHEKISPCSEGLSSLVIQDDYFKSDNSELETFDEQNRDEFVIVESKKETQTIINSELLDDVSVLSAESVSYAEVLRCSKSSIDQFSIADSLEIAEDINLLDEYQSFTGNNENDFQASTKVDEISDHIPEVTIDTAVSSVVIYSLYENTEFPDAVASDEHYEKQDHDQHEVDQHDETFHKIRHKRNKRRNKKNRKCNSENFEEQTPKNIHENSNYQGEYQGRRRNSRRWRNSRSYYEAFHQYQTHQEYFADPHWKFTKMD